MGVSTNRRRFLAATASAVAIAGCSESETTDQSESDESAPEVEPSGTWTSYQYSRLNSGATDPGDPPVENVTEAWTFEADDEVTSGTSIHDGTVYVPSEDEHLYALSLEDGSKQWSFDADSLMYAHAPAVAGQTVYQTTDDGTLYAIDTESGEQRWEYEGENAVNSGAVVSESTVFFSGSGEKIYAVDRKTGDEQWTFKAADNVGEMPCYKDGAVYAAANDNHLYKIDAESGEEIWNCRTDDRPGTPTVYDGTVYASTIEGTMYALNTDDGSEQWTAGAGGRVTSPVVTDDTIYGDSSYGIDTWDRTAGTREQEFAESSDFGGAVAYIDGTLYFAREDAFVRAIDATDGTEHWRHDIGYAAETAPAVGEGYVVIGTIRGEVYALN